MSQVCIFTVSKGEHFFLGMGTLSEIVIVIPVDNHPQKVKPIFRLADCHPLISQEC